MTIAVQLVGDHFELEGFGISAMQIQTDPTGRLALLSCPLCHTGRLFVLTEETFHFDHAVKCRFIAALARVIEAHPELPDGPGGVVRLPAPCAGRACKE